MRSVESRASDSFITKKSEFIGVLAPLQSMDQVKTLVQDEWRTHSDARHIAWAALADHKVKIDDDNEPSGTAGMPILNVLQHKELSQVICLVIRYFGGIKLGAGGLTRAYSQAASLAVQASEIIEDETRDHCTLVVDYKREDLVRRILSGWDAEIKSTQYGNNWQADISFAEKNKQQLVRDLTDQCLGQIQFYFTPDH